MEKFDNLRADFRNLANATRTKCNASYCKIEKDSLAKKDIFLGIRMPHIREFTRRCQNIALNDCKKLLQSEIHEERMLGLLILVEKYKRGSGIEQDEVYSLYLENVDAANHWDLVDQSSRFIIGPHLERVGIEVLRELASSKFWWRRRIAIVSTLYQIRRCFFTITFTIAKILLQDDHDLVQKAVGWMIKEISKRDKRAAELFLSDNYTNMPRTMLRCAIEKFSVEKRRAFLAGTISSLTT